jgi:hypothetical protein
MRRTSPTLVLEWTALCTEVRRPWLPSWRGALAWRGFGAPPAGWSADAPLPVAVCALLTLNHAFATEAQALTWLTIGRHAQHACSDWNTARHERSRVRDALEVVRYWQRQGNAGQAARAAAELAVCRARYRRRMRSFRLQLDYVRGPLGMDAVSARSQNGRSGPLARTVARDARVGAIPPFAALPREPATNVG